MSAWLGLHNQVWHDLLPRFEMAKCRRCRDPFDCSESNPCRCCLAAEVERLSAEKAEVLKVLMGLRESSGAVIDDQDRRIAEALADIRALILTLEWDRDLILAGRIEEALRGDA